MENADNTLLEMRQQMHELREKLESQKIVNERILRNSMRGTTQLLRIKSRAPFFACGVALCLIPALYEMGLSTFFLIFTAALVLIIIVRTVILTQLIPRMDEDLVTAAKKISRFHRIRANWLNYGLPIYIVWIGLLCWDLWKNTEAFADKYLIRSVCCIVVGILIGLLAGLKSRRVILDDAETLLKQLKELQLE